MNVYKLHLAHSNYNSESMMLTFLFFKNILYRTMKIKNRNKDYRALAVTYAWEYLSNLSYKSHIYKIKTMTLTSTNTHP